MQLNPCYLYSNKIEVYINLDNWPIEGYKKVYQRPFNLFKGVDNRLDFQIKNRDQKSKSIQGHRLFFNMLTTDYRPVIVSRECSYDDKEGGRAYVSLNEDDLVDLVYGSYYFSMYATAEDSSDVKTPLYGDSQFGVIGTINLIANVFPDPVPDVEPNLKALALGDFYYSDVFAAFDDKDSHLFKLYTTSFTGTVVIEATKEITTEPSVWKEVDVVPLSNITGVVDRTVAGVWTHFRIKHGQDTTNSAKFTIGQNTNGLYSASVYDGGKGYSVGDVITITGSKLDGGDGVNDLNITVTAVNYAGSIVSISWSGTSTIGVRSFVLEGTGNPIKGSLDKVAYRY
jgi:hypothetical protein